MSPAFDQLNSRLVLPDDSLAMPVCGKRDNLKMETWRELASRFGIGKRAADRVLGEIGALVEAAVAIVADAPLPEAMRQQYCEQLQQRAPG